MTIIAVEYFSRPELDRLMWSVARHEPETPVILSINSGYRGSGRIEFDSAFPLATKIHNTENLGYAAGVNQALTLVRTPYVAILNPDIELTHTISPVIERIFAQDDRLAAFGPHIVDGDGNSMPSFRRFITPRVILARIVLRFFKISSLARIQARYFMEDRDRGVSAYVDWISGGAMFVRRRSFESVEGMDPRYFLYMEDMDLCRTFWRSAWRVAFVPRIKLIHRAHFDSTRRGAFGLFSIAARNHLTSYFKYFRKWGFSTYSPSGEIPREETSNIEAVG